MGIAMLLGLGQFVTPMQVVSAKVDAKAAIGIAKQALIHCGAKNPKLYSFTMVSDRRDADPWWSLSFQAENRVQGPCYATVSPKDGSLISIQFGERNGPANKAKTGEPADMEIFAKKILKLLGCNQNVKVSKIIVANPNSIVEFKLQVKGEPILNHQDWRGYKIQFDYVTKQVRNFQASMWVPPLDKRPVAVNRGKAVALLDEALKSTNIYRQYLETFAANGPLQTSMEPKLGYFVLPKEKITRHVWSGTGAIKQNIGKNLVTLNTVRVMVDAVTGEKLSLGDWDALPQ